MPPAPHDDSGWHRLIRSFILSSPSFQLGDVVNHCRTVSPVTVSASKELSTTISDACRDRNEAELLVLPAAGGSGPPGVVCAAARLELHAGFVRYTDQRNGGRAFDVDHCRQECISVSPYSAGDSTSIMADPYRAAVERELDKYLALHYPCNGGTAGCAVYRRDGEKPGAIMLEILLASRNSRPQGYWSGSWGSVWRVTMEPGQTAPVVLEGHVQIASHYSENGNVQFQHKKLASRELSAKALAGVDSFACEVVQAIQAVESQIHENTEALVDSLSTDAVKALRRVLPVSKERFDWRPIRHALVRDMKEATVQR
eukprot:gnl/TRDRNA2_/TRDRNA2_135821_c1_seq1.p1 gnl/TRDRNA2_/TRDRNA2_135821_c1~~gnl/TRDRNA2_/TRDRNA2_135821_c1_seq1.p1  ORF type:complete len:327 (+),score=56.78 gnl/TRDRNA2_/TRDRNA2_135821_c1_seq1:41-982(+)